MSFDAAALTQWFTSHRRALPWRDQPSPYAVWVSEVMLQQTQVSVVIPYFERWMERFPTVQALAKAEIEEVMKLWEGLGYYSRARNLHAGAKYVVEQFKGQIPQEEEALVKIKGLGPYTVAAIRAFAFKQKAAAVDGNVLRVLARLFAIQQPIDQPKVIKYIRQLAQEAMPDDEPWLAAEGVIELGATVCTKRPQCERCPLKQTCQGYAQNLQDVLPMRRKRTATQKLYRTVLVIQSERGLLVRQCEEGEVMSGLHEFPYFDTQEEGLLADQVTCRFPLPLAWLYSLTPVSHTFTRYRVKLDPMIFYCPDPENVSGYRWISMDSIGRMAFSSGHKRILNAVLKEESR